jgi:hypothetical protein
MLEGIVKGVALLFALATFITITIFLTLLGANLRSTTAAFSAPTATEQKQECETSRPSPSQTESGIDI